MKKAVVLITSLFFIMSLSLLIFKNLEDTNNFLEKQNHIYQISQIILAIKNTKSEVQRLLKDKPSQINQDLDNGGLSERISLKENLNINFELRNYDKININDLKKENTHSIEEFFSKNDVHDFYLLKETYREFLEENRNAIESSKQLNEFLNIYAKRSYSDEIFELENLIGFLDVNKYYELNIDVEFNNFNARAYYILGSDQKVKYYDISFN